ncbi:hypothetical protein CASFOL_012005 [Castilleja foliolosa]|uniref:Uncharacterized protein n=1 Tax=Castilleja foliolosa TaxID=1961234 RepID=A0ABD3DPR7_9LAMI
MGLNGNEKDVENSDSESNRNSNATGHDHDIASDSEGRVSRQPSHYGTEDEEDLSIQLGPKMTIKEHLEKDKFNGALNQTNCN